MFDGQVIAFYIVQVTTTTRPASGAAQRPTGPARAELIRTIVDLIAAVSGRHRCAVARRVHHSGISLGHLQILWILQEHGQLPVSRLAAWLGIGAPNATGLLDRMEQRGLVERIRADGDRRVVYARPTDLGRATIAELDGWRGDLIEQVLAPLADENLAAIRDAVSATLEASRADREAGDPATAWPERP